MKACRVCGETKPLGEFHLDKSRPDGYGNRCKPCVLEYARQRRLHHADAIKAQRRAFYLRNLDAERAVRREKYRAAAETRRAAARAYYAANRDQIRAKARERHIATRNERNERSRRWRQENREAKSEYNRQYLAANPERNRQGAHRRRLREAGFAVGRDESEYVRILRSDPCSYCNASAGTVDHIEALAVGGQGGWQNLTAACGCCNSSKHTTGLLKFLLKAA